MQVQKANGERIISLYKEYENASEDKKTQEKLRKWKKDLESLWKKLENGHTELITDENTELTDNYFAEGTYEKLKKIYENMLGRLNRRLGPENWHNEEAGTSSHPTMTTSKTNEPESDLQNDRTNEEERSLAKLRALWDAKAEILRNSILRTQAEKTASTVFLQQKIKTLDAQWKSLSEIGDEILKQENTEDILRSLIGAQEEYDQGLTMIQGGLKSGERVKLPPLEIPHFDGSYDKWKNFHDNFKQGIHDNIEIGNIQKMQYLKAHTRGEANKIIRHLQATADNYETAWEILNARYDHERKLIRSYYETARNIQRITRPTTRALRELHDIFKESLAVMENMGFISVNDHWVTNIIIDKLDDNTLQAFERSQKDPRKFPTLQGLLKFITERADSLESFKVASENYHHTPRRDNNHDSDRQSNFKKRNCVECSEDHGLFKCDKFRKYDVNQRWEVVKRNKLCTICFGQHFQRDCKSKFKCDKCSGAHSKLLHNDMKKDKTNPRNAVISNTTTNKNSEVFLGTALVKCKTKHGDFIILRAMIDNASQGSFITEDAVQKLQLNKNKIMAEVEGFGSTAAGTSKAEVAVELASITNDEYLTKIDALVVKKATRPIPSEPIDVSKFVHLNGIKLADPKFNETAPVDISIGADNYGEFILAGIIKAEKDMPYAQLTTLGWIVMGKTGSKPKRILSYVTNVKLEEQLKLVWQLEAIETNPRAVEDNECEEFFIRNYSRGEDGRYTVAIPFRNTISNLGRSRKMAVAQMLQLEKRFRADKAFKEKYVACMNEYIELGHMKKVTTTEEEMITKNNEKIQVNTAYLPHHAVIKESSSTTKLRVVFDASFTNAINKDIIRWRF